MTKDPKARSRLTSQGQVSVPARVRETLGLGAGSVLEWEATDGHVMVRRVGANTSADVHAVVFDSAPTSRSLKALKEGIRTHARARHARD